MRTQRLHPTRLCEPLCLLSLVAAALLGCGQGTTEKPSEPGAVESPSGDLPYPSQIAPEDGNVAPPSDGAVVPPGDGAVVPPAAGSDLPPADGSVVPPAPTPEPTPEPPAVLLALGDIAGDPSTSNDDLTAALVDTLVARDPEARIQTSGDNAQVNGATVEYTQWFQTNWGRHLSRLHPAPGNHDYYTSGAGPYYAYFGALAGTAGKGWYAYDLNSSWRVMVLNSNVAHNPGSEQYTWFQNELETHATKNVIAVWHHPRYTSGEKYGPGLTSMNDLYALAVSHGVDIVLSSHDHHYESFEPQDSAGVKDLAHGARQFIVGTGGWKTAYTADNLAPNSRARITYTEGVTRFALYPDHYEWEFVPVAGKSPSDRGSSPVSTPP